MKGSEGPAKVRQQFGWKPTTCVCCRRCSLTIRGQDRLNAHWLGPESSCRGRSSLVRAVTGANAPQGLGEDFFGLLCGAGFTAVIHLGKIVPQIFDEFFAALLRESRGLEIGRA